MSEHFEPLESDRLILRRFQASDVGPFHAYRSNPTIARYQGWSDFTREDAERFIAEQATRIPGTLGTGAQVALEHKASGEMIGDVYLNTPAGTPQEARIGFTLDPAHQGKGLATEAVTALLDHVFGPLAKHRVTALTYARNERSIALLERIGMRREAHHMESSRLDDEWADDYVYAILRREWRDLRRGPPHEEP